MYAQAVRIPPVHLRGKRIQSSASEQCAKGCAFPDVQLDCIKYLKLGEADGVSGVLFTVTLDISDESLKAGKYPVDIEIIEVTDDTGAVISAAAVDGEVDLTVAVILGDVNQDGVVDNRDLIMIARYLVDLVSFSYDQKILADFNEDGTVNNTDLVLISRFLVA